MEQKSSLDQTSSESFFFFNPRTPCGVRQTGGEITWTRCWFQSTHSLRSATHRFQLAAIHPLFQSTHSLRSATVHFKDYCVPLWVSIHALLAECDALIGKNPLRKASFNPRTPCGVRLIFLFGVFVITVVSIHALLAECDITSLDVKTFNYSFNPRTPCGVRLHDILTHLGVPSVSIHALLAECDFFAYQR